MSIALGFTKPLIPASSGSLLIPNARLEMPSLFYPRRRPAGKMKVDWNHPLTKGLKVCVMVDGSTGRQSKNLAELGGNSLIHHSSAVLSGHSVEYFVNTALSSIDTLTAYSGTDITTLSIYRNTGGFPNTYAYIQYSSAWNHHSIILRNATGAVSVSATSPLIYDSDLSDGEKHVFLCRWQNNNNRLRVNGQELTHTTPNIGSDSVYTVGGRPGSSVRYASGCISLFLLWNATLTDAQAKSIETSPYQILIPQ